MTRARGGRGTGVSLGHQLQQGPGSPEPHPDQQMQVQSPSPEPRFRALATAGADTCHQAPLGQHEPSNPPPQATSCPGVESDGLWPKNKKGSSFIPGSQPKKIGEGEVPISPKGKPKSAGVEGLPQEEALLDGSEQAPKHNLAAEDEGAGLAERKLTKECALHLEERCRQEKQYRARNLIRQQENENECKQSASDGKPKL